jgi:NAD(P)-dependent dehydrogenase (short-subunit alcohol dehydrogenase family)
MSRIFITGSADGLGLLAAQSLLSQGHQVVLHARNARRTQDALAQAPGAEACLIADLSRADEVIDLAHQVNVLGRFDAVIHNAGVYTVPHEEIFAINSLAPYILTSLIGRDKEGWDEKPKRLIYLSSGMHTGGRALLNNLERGTGYSDSKFQIVLLAKAVARAWPTVFSNALDPGWVPTKMGGPGAPDDLDEGYATQVWLATSNDAAAKVSGKYFYHRKQARAASGANDTALQDAYIARMEAISGIPFHGAAEAH